MSEEPAALYELRDHVGVVSYNRPHRHNAMDDAGAAQVHEAMIRAREEAGARVCSQSNAKTSSVPPDRSLVLAWRLVERPLSGRPQRSTSGAVLTYGPERPLRVVDGRLRRFRRKQS